MCDFGMGDSLAQPWLCLGHSPLLAIGGLAHAGPAKMAPSLAAINTHLLQMTQGFLFAVIWGKQINRGLSSQVGQRQLGAGGIRAMQPEGSVGAAAPETWMGVPFKSAAKPVTTGGAEGIVTFTLWMSYEPGVIATFTDACWVGACSHCTWTE